MSRSINKVYPFEKEDGLSTYDLLLLFSKKKDNYKNSKYDDSYENIAA